MKRLCIAVLAVVALGALIASSAFALPGISKEGEWSGKSVAGTTPTLETMAEGTITCKEASASGKDSSASLGTFTINFKENCQDPKVGVKCESLGDAAGFILTGGEYHLVWDSLTTLGVALLFLPKELHLQCTALVLILIKSQSANGGVICLIAAPESSKATHIFKCEQLKKRKVYKLRRFTGTTKKKN